MMALSTAPSSGGRSVSSMEVRGSVEHSSGPARGAIAARRSVGGWCGIGMVSECSPIIKSQGPKTNGGGWITPITPLSGGVMGVIHRRWELGFWELGASYGSKRAGWCGAA